MQPYVSIRYFFQKLITSYYIAIIIIKEIVYPKINSVVMFPYDFLQWNANGVKG